MTQERSVDAGPLEGVPVVNTEDLDATWREAPRLWGHSMHKMAPYVGGYPPALAHYFILRYTDKGDRVLDPFCGGGTTPFEALQLGRQAVGNDAFSYAYILSHAKCNAPDREEFEAYVERVFDQAESLSQHELSEPGSDIEIFFHKDTLDMLLRLRKILKNDRSRDAMFLKALICGILHGPSNGYLSIQTKDTFSGTPDYVRDYIEKHDLEAEHRNVRDKVEQKYESVVEDGLPTDHADIHHGDARFIDEKEGSVDFVLTSPPYMHVLDYTWNNWLRLWWLGEEKDDERDDLVITADTEKYKKFIQETLTELDRVLSSDSRAVIVIGDVKKHRKAGTKKVRVPRIIAKEAKDVGFDVEKVIDDAYGIEKRSYKKFSEIRHETEIQDDSEDEELIDRCIILTKGSPEVDNEIEPEWGSE